MKKEHKEKAVKELVELLFDKQLKQDNDSNFKVTVESINKNQMDDFVDVMSKFSANYNLKRSGTGICITITL